MMLQFQFNDRVALSSCNRRSIDGGGFGARLKRMGFEWTDLVYVARASQVYGAELKEVEKSIQLLINPILSLR